MSIESSPYEQPIKPGGDANEHLEVIRTISRVPGNLNYHEKNGLRTEGDGVDHTHYNSVSLLDGSTHVI